MKYHRFLNPYKHKKWCHSRRRFVSLVFLWPLVVLALKQFAGISNHSVELTEASKWNFLLADAPTHLKSKIKDHIDSRENATRLSGHCSGRLLNWRPCVNEIIAEHQDFIARNCVDSENSPTTQGHLYQISQCPPIFIFDSGLNHGGDEYEVFLGASRETSIHLEIVDLENGLYSFQLPTGFESITIHLLDPQLHVFLIFTQCDGMRPPPDPIIDYLIGTWIVSEVRPILCSGVSKGSEMKDLLTNKPPKDRTFHFMGDNTILSLMFQMPRGLKKGSFSRLGNSLNMDLMAQAIKKVKLSQSKGNIIVLSNALADLKSVEHSDYFLNLAQTLNKAISLSKNAVGNQNVLLLTGPRILPHRVLCQEILNANERRKCQARIQFASNSRMRLQNDIYRVLADYHEIKLVDTYSLLFTFMNHHFAWRGNWQFGRSATNELWQGILSQFQEVSSK